MIFYIYSQKIIITNSEKMNQDGKDISNRQKANHYRIITSILLFLLATQTALYLFLNHHAQQSEQTLKKLLQNVPKFSLQKNPLAQFNDKFNLDSLQAQMDSIKKQILQIGKQEQFKRLYGSTLDQFQKTSAALLQLKQQISKVDNQVYNKQEATEQRLDQTSQQYRFIFPKTIWIYEQLKQGYFQVMNQLYIENIKRVSSENGYSIQFINHYNYASFVRKRRMLIVTQTLQTLKARMDSQTQPLLTDQVYSQIKRTLIMLLVLEENGGIMISKYFAMVQSLDWLRTITLSKVINRGQQGLLPKVFGFYNISRSSARIQLNRTSDNRFKFLVKYPGIIPYFLVAVKGSEFVRDLLSSICSLLQNPKQYLQSSEQFKKTRKTQFLYFISHNKIYDEFFEMATMNVLLSKEHRMRDAENKSLIGSDYYGIVTMNANYGPQKISFFFENNQGLKILKHLSHFHLSQFQAQIGKVRYISRLPSYYELNDYVNNLTILQETLTKGSFFHQIFYPQSNEPFLVERIEVPTVDKQAKPWEQLPKLIWVYWHLGLQNSNIIYQLCADNLKRYGLQSNFTINIVGDSNLKTYLSPQSLKKIEEAVGNQASIIKSKYIKYDLIRLALLVEHGGIYMDLSYILTQNLDWLVNIGKYPSNFIFNRYGDRPKVFMFFHPHYGSPFNWKVNPHSNSKVSWLLGYENNFIAAQKNNELITEWFEELIISTQTPYEQLEKLYIRCNVYEQRWTRFNDVYLLAMDTIKYVIGRKQKELEQTINNRYWDASDYYKIWSMNGYLGQQKFRSHTSYDTNNHDNLFIRLFSQSDAEEIIGPVFHLTKLYNYPVKFLYSNFMATYGNLTRQFHQQSIFMKYIFNQSRHSMQKFGKKGEKQKLIINQ